MHDFKPGEEKLERFWVSQAALIIRDNKILILKNASIDEWFFPGGRADLGERGDEALGRELKEEINVDCYKKIAVIDYDLWYTPHRAIPVCSIANLIDIGDAGIKLSNEHTEFSWITEPEIDKYKFAWPKAKDFIKKAFELKKIYE